MKQADLDSWVKRISYKPGWELRAQFIEREPPVFNQIKITVGYHGTNSVPGHQHQTIPIHHARLIPAFAVDFDWFVQACILIFQELENHESREWLRVDGKHYPHFVPHDPENDWQAQYHPLTTE